jgi:hypothetical protein
LKARKAPPWLEFHLRLWALLVSNQLNCLSPTTHKVYFQSPHFGLHDIASNFARLFTASATETSGLSGIAAAPSQLENFGPENTSLSVTSKHGVVLVRGTCIISVTHGTLHIMHFRKNTHGSLP